MTGDWVADLAIWVAAHVGRVVWWLVWTPTRRAVGVSPVLPLIYWAAVLWLWGVGLAGARAGTRVFAGGEDVRSFDPEDGRSSWIGLWPVAIIRTQVRAKALYAAGRMGIGFPSSVAIYLTGLLGWWTVLVVALPPAVWLRRRTRQPAW